MEMTSCSWLRLLADLSFAVNGHPNQQRRQVASKRSMTYFNIHTQCRPFHWERCEAWNPPLLGKFVRSLKLEITGLWWLGVSTTVPL